MSATTPDMMADKTSNVEQQLPFLGALFSFAFIIFLVCWLLIGCFSANLRIAQCGLRPCHCTSLCVIIVPVGYFLTLQALRIFNVHYSVWSSSFGGHAPERAI